MKFNFKVNLLKELDDHLVSLNKEGRLYRTPREKPHIWPTDASVQWVASNGLTITEGSCLRAIYYRLNGYPVTDEPIPRMHWVWKAGNDWEDHCNAISKQKRMLAASSLKFQDTSLPLKISGEMDAVNYYDDVHGNRHFYVIDYKSTGGSYYNQVKLMGNSKNKAFPKIANLLQLMVYLYQDPKLEFGMLVYLIRDKMDRTQFEIELVKDEESGLLVAKVNGELYPKYSINEIYRRYMLLCDFYERQQLPPRDFEFEYTDEKARMLNEVGELSDSALKKHLTKNGKSKQGHWMCNYCDFRQQCELDGET